MALALPLAFGGEAQLPCDVHAETRVLGCEWWQEKARYTFRVEWFDQAASLKRQYLLFYILRLDGVDEIEIVCGMACACEETAADCLRCCVRRDS